MFEGNGVLQVVSLDAGDLWKSRSGFGEFFFSGVSNLELFKDLSEVCFFTRCFPWDFRDSEIFSKDFLQLSLRRLLLWPVLCEGHKLLSSGPCF